MKSHNFAITAITIVALAQVGFAVAGQGTFPMSADDQYGKPLPAQLKYLEQRAASIQGMVRGDSFPPSADALYSKMLPAQVKYFEQRTANTQAAARSDSFPPSADDLYSKILPAQAKYFEQREGRI